MWGKNKGQSTLEYITIFVAIVAAVIILAYAKFKPAVESLYNGVGSRLTNAATTFQSGSLGD
ncbi:MAG: hypothetical protein NT066_05875 [Candidatus Omnitrophica bacterium]|nr:hypothetical protein [Candidatus Omnitrophota bacterium]